MVISRGGARTPEMEALAHVAGYACLDDRSVRDFRKHSLWAGKASVRSAGCGP